MLQVVFVIPSVLFTPVEESSWTPLLSDMVPFLFLPLQLYGMPLLVILYQLIIHPILNGKANLLLFDALGFITLDEALSSHLIYHRTLHQNAFIFSKKMAHAGKNLVSRRAIS